MHACNDNGRPARTDVSSPVLSTGGLRKKVSRHPLTINVPGFGECSLLNDGWVQSSGNLLFWVPPDNRYGLQRRHLLLTMPTSSPSRATKLDFTNFRCGLSWTNVRNNIS